MTLTDPTRDPAPPQYLPCPGCGASTFTRADVKKHDAWHEQERKRAQRTDALLDRLEAFLEAVEGDAATIAEGETVTFPEWMNSVDEALAELRDARPASGALALTAGDWHAADEEDDDDGLAPGAPVDLADFSGIADDADEDSGDALGAVAAGPDAPAEDDLEEPAGPAWGGRR